MKSTELQDLLSYHSGLPLRLKLPRGNGLAFPIRIDEAVLVEKPFIDSFGRRCKMLACRLLVSAGADDQRFLACRLAGMLDRISAATDEENLPLEMECDNGSVSQQPILRVMRQHGALVFHLTNHRDCPKTASLSSCDDGA